MKTSNALAFAVLASVCTQSWTAHASDPHISCAPATTWTYHQNFYNLGALDIRAKALVKNPIDGKLWAMLTLSYQGYTRYQLLKQDSNGDFIEDVFYNLTDLTRKFYPTAMTFDPSGNLWISGSHSNASDLDWKVFVRKRTTAGVWSDVIAGYQYNGKESRISGMAARGTGSSAYVYLNGFSTESTGRRSWNFFKIQVSNSSLVRQDVTPFTGLSATDHADPGAIKLGPSSTLWLTGGQKDAAHVTRAMILKENTGNGLFPIAVNYRKQTTFDGQERFNDITFSSNNLYYYVVHGYKQSSTSNLRGAQMIAGQVATPTTMSIYDTGAAYGSQTSITYASIVNAANSDYLYVGGTAADGAFGDPAANWTQLVRKSVYGGFGALTASDASPLNSSFGPGSMIESLVASDGGGNVWSLEGLIQTASNTQGVAFFKRLACL